MTKRYNIFRGYMKLMIWHYAKEYYRVAASIYHSHEPVFLRVYSNQIACIDSSHLNIAEGYCRKSKKEYIRFLDIALGSLGESTSGNHVYKQSNQITSNQFEMLYEIAYKLENSIRKPLDSLRTMSKESWSDTLNVRENEVLYSSIPAPRQGLSGFENSLQNLIK